MSFKPMLFILFFALILSCGSSKQVVSSEPEAKVVVNAEDRVINVQLEPQITPEPEPEVEPEVAVDAEIKETVEINESTDEPIANNPVKESEKSSVSEEDLVPVNHDLWQELLQKHVTVNGNVNYKGFKSDRVKFYRYIEELQNNVPSVSWNRNDKLSYWINAYNAFTVDLILRNYPLKSIKDIKDPWDQRLWKIDEKWYNLNDIEHKILRKMDEPRIHFAIVCASISCPKLQNSAFLSSELDSQLRQATEEFLSDRSKNELTADHIKLSKIFKWFGKDFKTNSSNLIDFLNEYTELNIIQSAKKSYLDYNWDLNE